MVARRGWRNGGPGVAAHDRSFGCPRSEPAGARRMDSPDSSMRSALSRILSRAASAMVGSAMAWCHIAIGSWLVMMVARSPALPPHPAHVNVRGPDYYN